ncbi:MAG: glycosyltransferase [Clostridia bacterium]|nr:glycosyltransferase [Clostridia bacterium]
MRVAQINVTCGAGSTGKICLEVSKLLTERGVENRIYYTSGKSDYPLGVKYASDKYIKLQALKSRIFGKYGFNSKSATKKLIKHLEEFKPDIIQLHNLHGHNVHLGMLFDYIRKNNIKTFWTFHDCWTFTGYCPHYAMVKCDKWRDGCHACVRRREFSWFFDKSDWLFNEKKSITEGVDLTVICPSEWMAKQVNQSFLGNFKIQVINNGIDLGVFKPTESDFREKYVLENKKIVLGVAFDWGIRKGLDVFLELAKRLPKDYQIVLVGTNDEVDKRLPDNIISIHRTANQRELAEIYTASDVFVNATREDTYPTVNMEAIACGTPVVTFETGGSPEMIDEKTGICIEADNIDKLEKAIRKICNQEEFSSSEILEKAKDFDSITSFKKYIDNYCN